MSRDSGEIIFAAGQQDVSQGPLDKETPEFKAGDLTLQGWGFRIVPEESRQAGPDTSVQPRAGRQLASKAKVSQYKSAPRVLGLSADEILFKL